MLAATLVNGKTIKGLSRLLDGGGLVGANRGQVNERTVIGSYTINDMIIEFFDNNQGDTPVNILPYVAGAINYTQMQGRETISGEFTGCTMAIYKYEGSNRVCHVDTAKSSNGDAPSKQTWADLKAQGNLELTCETSTSGMIPSFLDSLRQGTDHGEFQSLCILCVATPGRGISSFYVLKENQDYRVLRLVGKSLYGN